MKVIVCTQEEDLQRASDTNVTSFDIQAPP